MSEIHFCKFAITGVELCLSWRPACNGDIPEGAVDAWDGCYAARAQHKDHWIPGKLIKGNKFASVSFGGQEFHKECYEVLSHSDIGCFGCGHGWVHVTDGHLPQRALVAGVDRDAIPLFMARARVQPEGELCSGKAYPNLKRAFFPLNGQERGADDFEVLAFNVINK